jgi:putative glutamine amidotransferase
MPVIGLTACRKIEDYRQAVLHVGGGVHIVDASMAVGEVIDGIDGLLLTGGEDLAPARYGEAPHPSVVDVDPARDEFEIALVGEARRRNLPILGICRGIQVLNVALGGTLVQDIPSERPGALAHEAGTARAARAHDVEVEPGSRLASALGATRLAVNSSHHQSVDRPAPRLRITARSDDGIVEGLETDRHDPWYAVGVQWHPEDLVDTEEPWDRQLFATFAGRL